MPVFSHRAALIALTVGALGTSAIFGPPRITVRQVTDPATAPAGAVLLIEAQHHTDHGPMKVTGRAEGMRNGQRVQQALTINSLGANKFSVTKQWPTGTAWVLLFAAEQGEPVPHGVAEAMLQVNADGKIVGIEHPSAGWDDRTKEPIRISSRQIGDALSRLSLRP